MNSARQGLDRLSDQRYYQYIKDVPATEDEDRDRKESIIEGG
jgi:hypothetical protein